MRRASVLAATFVVLLTLLAYSGVGGLDFVSFDDPGYVTRNPTVLQGLGPNAWHYAFTSFKVANWHPLTWFTHMACVEWFGLEAAGHHWVNVGLHVVNAVLLLFVLRSATGRTWPSFAVAALFAVHPLHVESVAWISERKDVLSTLFWLLATWSWIRWTRTGGRFAYAGAVVLLALGLMSKAMLVTLPCTLLLLDGWPLRRWRGVAEGGRSARQLVVEKLPLFAIVAAFAAITYLVQASEGAVRSAQGFPLGSRLANAVTACGTYLWRTVWPRGLAPFYPYPREIDAGALALALATMVGLSALAWRVRQRLPAFTVGWAWFLGTLVPVIGLVQVGDQSHADRYTYVPHIGLFVALVWGALYLLERLRAARALVVVAIVLPLAVLVPVTRAQVALWENDGTLFAHTLAVTEENHLAHDFYGSYLRNQGRLDEAEAEYNEALRIRPDLASAHLKLGVVYLDRGQLALAASRFQTAIHYQPDVAMAWSNLAAAYGGLGRLDDSLEASLKAIELDPERASGSVNAATTCLSLGRPREAIEHYRNAFALEPQLKLGNKALEYAWLLSTHPDETLRDGEEALISARAFCESVQYRNVFGLEALAAALAETGRFDEARHLIRQAVQALRATGGGERAARFEGYDTLFAEGRPIRTAERLLRR